MRFLISNHGLFTKVCAKNIYIHPYCEEAVYIFAQTDRRRTQKNFNYGFRSGEIRLPIIFKLKVIPVFINSIFETINTISFYNRIR